MKALLKLNWIIQRFFFFIIFIICNVTYAQSDCNCDHVIAENTRFLDGDDLDIKPGDKICFEAGQYESLEMKNFAGTIDNRITFTNCGGQAQFARLRLENSQYFNLTGTGVDGINYGIFIDGSIDDRTDGLSISIFSTDFDVDHLEFANTKAAAFHMVMRPECDPATQRGNFTIKNVNIHDNYVHDIGTEGFYLGHTSYNGTDVECDGVTNKLFPVLIENLRVHHNVFNNTGWDAIQVSAAEKLPGALIYNNKITNYGTENVATQGGGIIIGGGSAARVFNNWIEKGGTGGVHVFGIGETYIYNNLIKDCGGVGVLIGNRSEVPEYGMHVVNNTILDVAEVGIRVNMGVNTANTISNNIIINPGAYDSEGTNVKSFISYSVDWPVSDEANYTSPNYDEISFVDFENENFYLNQNSPAANKGVDVSDLGITTDINSFPRAPNGFSIGAYEFGSEPTVVNIEEPITIAEIGSLMIYPNPIRDTDLIIEFNLVHSDSVEIALVDLNGKTTAILKENQVIAAGTNKIKISKEKLNISTLSDGVYFITIDIGDKRISKRLFVSKK